MQVQATLFSFVFVSWQQNLENLEKVQEFKQGHRNVRELRKSPGKMLVGENKVGLVILPIFSEKNE